MLRFFLFFFMSMLFISTTFAQNPVEYDQNILINSHEVGADLLLFTPDTATQILFNPARAATYNKSFIYTTYNSGYRGSYYSGDVILRTGDITIIEGGTNYPRSRFSDPYYSTQLPTFSLATLFNTDNSKWLLTLTNGIRYSDYEDNSNETDSQFYGNSIHEVIYDQDISDDSKTSVATVQLSKIESNYSYGIFGIFNQVDMNYENKTTRHHINSYSSFINHRYDIDKENSKLKNNQYKIGISYSLFGNHWDYIANVSYQKSDNQSDVFFNFTDSYIDSSSIDTLNNWNVNKRSYIFHGANFGKSKPDFYQIYNYYQRQLDWLFPKDNFFIKAKATLSKGRIEYNQDQNRLHKELNNNSIVSTDTSVIFGEGTIKPDNTWLNLSCGYTASFTLDDIYILAAINPGYQYVQITDIPFTQQRYRRYSRLISLTERKRTTYKLDVRLPIYINYSPAKWIDFYGGITYNYGYSGTDESQTALSDFTRDEGRVITTTDSYDYKVISSLKSRYLGMNLKHKSGLRLQVSFRNDITNYSYWDMALGYHF